MTPRQLKELRESINLSQQELADVLGKTRLTVNRWENGEKIPEAAQKLLQMFFSDTLKGQQKDTSVGDPEAEYITNSNGNRYRELPDGTFDVEVGVIPFTAYASYLESLETGTVMEDLSTTVFKVDHIGMGNYKAFVVRGDSMDGGKINDTKDGATVLGRELGRHHWKDGFRPTEYGWIILSKQNIFHKDIIDFDPETGDITCHSRNPSPEYADFKLNLNDVYKIFKVIKRIF